MWIGGKNYIQPNLGALWSPNTTHAQSNLEHLRNDDMGLMWSHDPTSGLIAGGNATSVFADLGVSRPTRLVGISGLDPANIALANAMYWRIRVFRESVPRSPLTGYDLDTHSGIKSNDGWTYTFTGWSGDIRPTPETLETFDVPGWVTSALDYELVTLLWCTGEPTITNGRKYWDARSNSWIVICWGQEVQGLTGTATHATTIRCTYDSWSDHGLGAGDTGTYIFGYTEVFGGRGWGSLDFSGYRDAAEYHGVELGELERLRLHGCHIIPETVQARAVLVETVNTGAYARLYASDAFQPCSIPAQQWETVDPSTRHRNPLYGNTYVDEADLERLYSVEINSEDEASSHQIRRLIQMCGHVHPVMICDDSADSGIRLQNTMIANLDGWSDAEPKTTHWRGKLEFSETV